MEQFYNSLLVHVENERVSDSEFRQFVRSSLPCILEMDQHLVIPEGMTEKQVMGFRRLYARSPDGSPTFAAFMRRFQRSCDGHFGGMWCGMYIGVEEDGYTHS